MKNPRNVCQAFLSAFVFVTLCSTGFGAPPVVESPVGSFGFDAPGDPPSGPPLITPMVFLNGPYTDSTYLDGASTYLTMDASGKVMSMSSVPGFTDKSGATTLSRVLYVRTVNGIPTLTANASAGGMYDDGSANATTSGSGKATVPFTTPSGTNSNGDVEVSVLSSFSGKRDKGTDKAPTEMNTVDLDATQLQGLVVKDWGVNLNVDERTNARTQAKYYVANLYFNNPDGTHTFFPDRAVKYFALAGYTITFSGGQLYDNSNNPILDARGKPVTDKNTTIKFSNLLFKKQFAPSTNEVSWEPAAGGVSYKFLGQSGFGHVFNFVISDFTGSS